MQELEKDIYLIVENSLSYPSGDNSQPFRFLYTKNNTLKISVDKDAENGPFGSIPYYISLGCLLEILSINAKMKSFELSFEVPELFYQPNNFVEIRFKKTKKSDQEATDDLSGMLAKRYTDRRAYKKTNIEKELIEILSEEGLSKSNNAFDVLIKASLSEDVVNQMCKVERHIWSDLFFVGIILKSINYTTIFRQQYKGMNIRNVGISPLLAVLGFFEKKFKWIFKLNVIFGRTKLNQFILKRQLINSGAFAVVTVSEINEKNLISVSRLICRLWIKVCGMGFSFQPLSACTLLPFSLKYEKNRSKDMQYFDEITKILKKEFNISSENEILWLFRSGQPFSEISDKAKTRRKPMNEVWRSE